MTAAVGAELLKLGRRPLVRTLIACALLALLGVRYGVEYIAYLDMHAGTLPGDPTSALLRLQPSAAVARVAGSVGLEGAAIGLMLGAFAAGAEHEYGALKTVLTQQGSRWRVWAGQALAVIAIAGTLVAALLLAALGAGAAIAAASDAPLAFPSAGDLLRGLGGGWLIVAMWSACGLLLATVARSAPLAVGVGLVWMLGVERTVDELRAQFDILQAVYAWLPGANASGVTAALGHRPRIASEMLGERLVGGQLPLVLAAYLTVFLVVTAATLRARDVT